MTALNRKLLRDLWQIRGQAAAIGLVIACGVATFVMSLSTLESLKRAQDTYYERYRFGSVFAHLKRAPQTLAARIAEIPGTAQMQTRVVEEVTLNVPGLAEPAVGRLLSLPARQGPMLNDLYLRSGRYIEPGRQGEVLVSEGFARANSLGPGDQITAVLNGKWQPLRIVGVALSPEFIYQIRPGDLLPDDRRFAVLWMGHEELAAAFDMEGAFNDVTLSLMPGTSEPEVLQRLDELLEPYGGLGGYGRDDQPSHKFVSNELKELRGMALVVPTIFLAVAAFLLNVVFARLIGTQREQIAALKAFGYTNLQVGWHYLKLVLLLVLGGVVLGTIVGLWLGRGVTEMYTRFFHFPVFAFHLDFGVIGLAILVTLVMALAGTLGAVRRAVVLPPAEAMRPEAPAIYQPTIFERLGLQRLLSPAARMILRQLERRPFRALSAILGIALAVAVLILGSFMLDAITYVLEAQFAIAQRQDLTITFIEPSAAETQHDIDHLPGVSRSECFRSLPVRLQSGQFARRVGVLGLEPEGSLFRLMDIHRRIVPLPPEGVVLSAKLAEVLHVGVGDSVVLEVLEGERPVRTVPVAGLIDDFSGLAAYMDRRAINRLMREGNLISGAYVAVDSARLDQLYTTLKATPRVSNVTIKSAALRSFQQTVAENLLRMRSFNIAFASIIAIGVVYNNARVSVAERSRELATLRVIGFTRTEISLILLGELAVLTLTAIPLGLILGYGLAATVIHLAYDTELFRMPLVVFPSTYAFAATVVLIASLASALVVRRLLDHLDLVAVLKTKE